MVKLSVEGTISILGFYYIGGWYGYQNKILSIKTIMAVGFAKEFSLIGISDSAMDSLFSHVIFIFGISIER